MESNRQLRAIKKCIALRYLIASLRLLFSPSLRPTVCFRDGNASLKFTLLQCISGNGGNTCQILGARSHFRVSEPPIKIQIRVNVRSPSIMLTLTQNGKCTNIRTSPINLNSLERTEIFGELILGPHRLQ